MPGQNVGRRDFMRRAATGAAAGAAVGIVAPATASGAEDPASAKPDAQPADMALSDIPNFCGHEHWGSIMALGTVEEGFRADVLQGTLPVRGVTVWDLVLDPYGWGWLNSGGSDLASS